MATVEEVRASGVGTSEDYARFSDAEIQDWLNRWPYDPGTGKFTNLYGDKVDKPDERGPNTPPNMNGTGDPGNYGGRGGGGGGRGGGRGRGGRGGQPWQTNAPQFEFEAPSYEEMLQTPGYQAAFGEGQRAIEGSAAARGTLRTGGTLKDLAQYGQGLAAQQYGDIYGRQYQLAKDQFAPQYGAWQLGQEHDLSRWTTRYGGDLSKYLQREQNIYGLLNQPPPGYGGY